MPDDIETVAEEVAEIVADAVEEAREEAQEQASDAIEMMADAAQASRIAELENRVEEIAQPNISEPAPHTHPEITDQLAAISAQIAEIAKPVADPVEDVLEGAEEIAAPVVEPVSDAIKEAEEDVSDTAPKNRGHFLFRKWGRN